jgi:hypothetical protein
MQLWKSKAAAMAALLVTLATLGVAGSAHAGGTLVVSDGLTADGACVLAINTASTTGQAPYDDVTFQAVNGMTVYLDPSSAGGTANRLQTVVPPPGLFCYPPPLTLCVNYPSVFTWAPTGLPSGPNQVAFSCCPVSPGCSSPPAFADPQALVVTVNAPVNVPALPRTAGVLLAFALLATALLSMRLWRRGAPARP